MTTARATVFLVDVDNTLLDNDRVAADLLDYDLEALLDAANHGACQPAPAQRERSIA